MSGTIHVNYSLQVRKGIWQVRLSWTSEDGQHHQKQKSTRLSEKGNKRKAAAVAEDLVRQLERELQSSQNDGLKTYSGLFLDEMWNWLCQIMPYQIRENTLYQYKRAFEAHIRSYAPFQRMRLQEVTPKVIQGYYNGLCQTLSPNTVVKLHSNIHKFFEYCMDMGWIENNPSERVALPKKHRATVGKAYTAAQAKKLLELFRSHELLYPAVYLALHFGLRREEVCGLRWQDLDLERGIMHICHTAVAVRGKVVRADRTKSEASNRELHILPVHQVFFQEIKRRQAEWQNDFKEMYHLSGYVCTHEDGRPLDPNMLTKKFRQALMDYAERLNPGFPVLRFHDLRHTSASLMYEQGADLKDIQYRMGHSQLSTTSDIYAHMTGIRSHRAAEKLAEVLT